MGALVRRRAVGFGTVAETPATIEVNGTPVAATPAAPAKKGIGVGGVVTGVLLFGGMTAIKLGTLAAVGGGVTWALTKKPTSTKAAKVAKYGAYGVAGGFAAFVLGFSGVAMIADGG